MATIPIRDVPGEAVEPSGNELILIDNGIDMQKATINDAVTPKATEITDQKISDLDLGSASQADVEDFATAEQGNKADSAVQPDDLAPVATSGDYNDLTNLPTLGTAAEADVGDFAPAAQAVPTGGSAGQVLAKASDDDNDVEWTDAGVGDMLKTQYDPQGKSTDAFELSNQTAGGEPVGSTGLALAASETEDDARQTLGANDASNLTTGTLPNARVSNSLTPDKAFRRGNILGTVSQSGGTPTGALMQYGATGTGQFMRLAGNLQICWANLSGSAAENFTWTFPAAFAELPSISCTVGTSAFRVIMLNMSQSDGTKVACRLVNNDGTETTGGAPLLTAIGRWH